MHTIVNGRLDLVFSRRAERAYTTMRVRQQHAPLQVVRAFPIPHGGALAHLHNISGGVLGGDQLRLAVEVQAGAYAQLTTTGATRLYRCRAGRGAAEQHTVVRIGEGAILEYVPDPLLPYAGAAYRQHTHVELADGAGLMWWEIVAPGREAHGECWAYDLLESDFRIVAAGETVALERARLQPQERPLTSPARMGPYRYYASFYICRVGVPNATWRTLEARLADLAACRSVSGTLWGVSTLPAHGLAIRGLSLAGRMLYSGLVAFWQEAKRALYDQTVVPPRKLY
jgi:urease accessory protein